tara:strand:+ start:1296 stop:2375 length:1080 start_codon:yes stop_codon:yes gene_type:complete
MKIKLLALALALSSMNISAQITVADTDLMSVGDIITQANDSLPSPLISIGNSGANQFWDFSSLQEMEIETIEVVSPVGTLYGSMYTNANICVEMDDDLLYLDKTSSGLVMVGFGELPVNVLMLPLPLIYNLTHQDGPNTIMDSVFANSGFFDNSLAPVISLNPLYDQIDSLKIKAVITSDFNVDAWGNVAIPLGNYDALRLKVEETTSTEFYTYCSAGGLGGGWFSAETFFPIETEIANRYQWWSNDPIFNFMLAELEVDSVDNVQSVTFLTNPQASSVANLSDYNVKIYPVPANKYITVEAKKNDITSLDLVDVNGKVILKKEFTQSTSLDVSDIAKGIYFLNLKTVAGKLTKQIIIE